MYETNIIYVSKLHRQIANALHDVAIKTSQVCLDNNKMY